MKKKIVTMLLAVAMGLVPWLPAAAMEAVQHPAQHLPEAQHLRQPLLLCTGGDHHTRRLCRGRLWRLRPQPFPPAPMARMCPFPTL